MNIITLSGRILGEISVKWFDSGASVTRFKVSVSTGKDKDGNYKPSLLFECNAWGKLGTEVVAKYAKEKDFVIVSGEITAMSPWSAGEKSGVNCNVDVRSFELGGKSLNESGNGVAEKQNEGKQKVAASNSFPMPDLEF
jgi:single-stranded DNA-binding protein